MSKELSGEIIRLLTEKGERIRNSQFSNLNTTEECYRRHNSGKLGRAGPGDVPMCQHILNTCPHTQPGTPDEHDRQLLHEAWQEIEIYFPFFCPFLPGPVLFFFNPCCTHLVAQHRAMTKNHRGFGKEKHQQPPSKANCGAEGEQINSAPYNLIHRRF